MTPESPSWHLSHIATPWSLLCQAHPDADAARPARAELIRRYQQAVYAYLVGALRDREAAQEVLQEFCVRFLRGDFRHADPEKGRFRDYVRSALSHLAGDYQRRRRRQPGGLPEHVAAALIAPGPEGLARLVASWREELIGRAWQSLAEEEHSRGTPYHTVLRLRAERPELSGAELAEQVGRQLGAPQAEARFRQLLHRAREKFAESLWQDVAHSLEHPSPEQVEEELSELGLLPYCQSAAKRRRGP